MSSSPDPWVARAWAASDWVDGHEAMCDGSRMTDLRASGTGAAAAYITPPPARDDGVAPTQSHFDTVAFRTTLTFVDVLHDFDLRQVKFIGAARVHRGIYRKYMSLRDKLHALVQLHAPRTLLLTGHSLGGALAALAAVDLHAHYEDVELHVVTFGAPRVGNAAFTTQLASATRSYVRVRDPHDLIPDMPGALLGFTHGDSDEVNTVYDILSRLMHTIVSFISLPNTHHFHHQHEYYRDSMRARRAQIVSGR